MKRVLAVAMGIAWMALFAGCAGDAGPRPIRFGTDTCARCRMQLTGPGFGGELRDPGGGLTVYDDVGCLLEAMADTGAEPPAWVEDHVTGELVELSRAVLVRGSRVETPMNHGVLAFGDEATARRFVESQGGEVVALADLEPGGPSSQGGRPTDEDAREGKVLYLRECASCHGDRGRGDGPAAAFLAPKPRDFTRQQFKLRTTEGPVPATADLLRTMERGLPGSAMPSFSFLTAEERRQIAGHVLDLADLLETPEPEVLDLSHPPPPTPESVARGQVVYQQMQCGACHGASGRGDGPSAAALKTEDGDPIPVRDLTRGRFLGGDDRDSLYLRLVTGMDGTPMPSFAGAIEPGDRWALVDFVRSLRQEAPSHPLPRDPIAAGRLVAEKFSCRGCHVLDDGKGGDVGPDLRVSGQKLGSDWVRDFLADPRAYGKIYPWRVPRMPRLALEKDEIDVLARYIAAMGKRQDAPVQPPDPAGFAAAQLDVGKNMFVLRCTECHALGTIIETPLVKQQGPDLIRVAHRVDYDWAKRWISDPQKIDPKTKMTTAGITPEQVDAVRMFVWKSSLETNAP